VLNRRSYFHRNPKSSRKDANTDHPFALGLAVSILREALIAASSAVETLMVA